MKTLGVAACLLALGSANLLAAKKPPMERVNFTAPFNVQIVVLKKAISVSWQWAQPDAMVEMKDFGFDIKRSDGKIYFSKSTAFQDDALAAGAYSYTVRTRGRIKEKGKWILLTSVWSETVSGTIVDVCPGPPRIDLTVTPTQKVYSSIPSLRFRLQGQVVMDNLCTLSGARYLIDAGRGMLQNKTLPVNKDGRFDAFVNALGPEDEIPTGVVSFNISVTAENEMGASTSDVFSLDVALQNRYAPH